MDKKKSFEKRNSIDCMWYKRTEMVSGIRKFVIEGWLAVSSSWQVFLEFDYLLLGSYYTYWSYKCFDPYFLDQPVRIFVNGGKFSYQFIQQEEWYSSKKNQYDGFLLRSSSAYN